jgi:hypothetical protein
MSRAPTPHTNIRRVLLIFVTTLSVAACGSGRKTASTQSAPDNALSGLAGQRIVLLPTYTVRVAPELGWATAIGRLRDVPRALDSAISNALADRGATKTWILPEALAASYRRNSTYGADPYALAEEPLRSSGLAREQRLPEPLASQVRTIVALHDEARFLLAPVELRFERAGPTTGRATLRLVLLDARASDVRWLGEVKTDSAAAYGPRLLNEVASRVADLVAK